MGVNLIVPRVEISELKSLDDAPVEIESSDLGLSITLMFLSEIIYTSGTETYLTDATKRVILLEELEDQFRLTFDLFMEEIRLMLSMHPVLS
jgi:hypothetical protein